MNGDFTVELNGGLTVERNGGFTIERVAVHLVDRQLPGPRFAQEEIDFTAFSESDIEVLGKFFSGHLDTIWKAPEGLRTRSAKFKGLAVMRGYYEQLTKSTSQFFDLSRHMAQRLHDVSQGKTTSPGLLMVLWFHKTGDERSFLGLLKMDPGRADKVTFRQDEAQNILLGLAVRQIERALPDPGTRILKWAAIPHPDRPTFDVKVKDQEAARDPAQYFMAFLGCEARLSAKEQAKVLLDTIPAYAQEYHPKEDWKAAAREVVEELEEEPVITPEVVKKKIQELGVLADFQEQAFQGKLVDAKVEDLHISPHDLQQRHIQYKLLPTNIIIRGPWAVMDDLVEIVPLNDDVEFRIRTPEYRKSYE